MRIKDIAWDDGTILHIAKHGVEPKEVEEVCFESNPFILKARHNRYYALGQTESGRYLTIIFEYIGQGKVRIITARAMSGSERRFFKRR